MEEKRKEEKEVAERLETTIMLFQELRKLTSIIAGMMDAVTIETRAIINQIEKGEREKEKPQDG